MRYLISIIILITCFLPTGNSQESNIPSAGCFFIEPEFLIGHKVPNYSASPDANCTKAFALSLGSFNNNPKKSWASFYNYPFTGIALSYCNLGNNQVFGDQYTIMPFIVFNTSNRLKNSINFKLGLGCSYFTKHYDEFVNPLNKEIGSGLNWSFQSFMYYEAYVSKYISINIGSGYLHSSNGHIKLPNYGMNQAVFSVSAKYFPKGINPAFQPKSSRLPVNHDRCYYLMIRNGWGLQDYGNGYGSSGGPVRPVKSATLSAGVLLREHIKVDAGFAGRFYQHYYYQIKTGSDSSLLQKPKLNSSNLYFFIGFELLTGHLGMDIEGGLNLFKPFFRTHYETMHDNIGLEYWLKQLFNSRMGFNYYLINTNKNPRNNLYIGININANFGQADFSEICLGVTHFFPR